MCHSLLPVSGGWIVCVNNSCYYLAFSSSSVVFKIYLWHYIEHLLPLLHIIFKNLCHCFEFKLHLAVQQWNCSSTRKKPPKQLRNTPIHSCPQRTERQSKANYNERRATMALKIFLPFFFFPGKLQHIINPIATNAVSMWGSAGPHLHLWSSHHTAAEETTLWYKQHKKLYFTSVKYREPKWLQMHLCRSVV